MAVTKTRSTEPAVKGHQSLGIVIKLGEPPPPPGEAKRQPCADLEKGTSSIVDEKTHEPLLSILTLIVETAWKLRKDGHKVVIVSSGAIGVGLRRMDVEKRPKHLSRLQVPIPRRRSRG
jgi:glutamate 5-kinase